MAAKENTTQATEEQVKQCCATLYESDLARCLLDDSFHPGGMHTTRRHLGYILIGATKPKRQI